MNLTMDLKRNKLFYHPKTGNVYRIICVAKDTDNILLERVIYQRCRDGSIWDRKRSEFESNGRFHDVSDMVRDGCDAETMIAILHQINAPRDDA
jgi:hypothetical protein